MALDLNVIRLKTWTSREPQQPYHFYMLSKGENAGKPMDAPCPTCFVVPARDEAERNILYGLCDALLQAQRFRYYICGSVIPFIHIRHAEGLLNHAYDRYKESPAEHSRQIELLRKLDQQEKNAKQQLALIKQLKYTVARKHFHDYPELFSGKGLKL